jgi:hypothetical protein
MFQNHRIQMIKISKKVILDLCSKIKVGNVIIIISLGKLYNLDK